MSQACRGNCIGHRPRTAGDGSGRVNATTAPSSDGIIRSCVLQCPSEGLCGTESQLPRAVSSSLMLLLLALLFSLSTFLTHIRNEINCLPDKLLLPKSLSQGLLSREPKLRQLHFPASLAGKKPVLTGLHSYVINFGLFCFS